MYKTLCVGPSEFIIFGHWKYNMLNFMSMLNVRRSILPQNAVMRACLGKCIE